MADLDLTEEDVEALLLRKCREAEAHGLRVLPDYQNPCACCPLGALLGPRLGEPFARRFPSFYPPPLDSRMEGFMAGFADNRILPTDDKMPDSWHAMYALGLRFRERALGEGFGGSAA